jgi:hypothetical protein
MKAKFRILNENSKVLLIEDLNGERSITNDANDVVSSLWFSNHIDGVKELFYVDTDKRVDQLLYDESHFMGFKPGYQNKTYFYALHDWCE